MRRQIPLLLILLATPQVHADVSTNIGWQSDYVFRGIPQSDSSAQGGIDYENSGWYLGTWAADVGLGAEVDVYGGYSFDVDDFSFGIGGTGYYYTDDFDDTYTELNLSAGYSFVTLDFAAGKYDNFGGPTLDYNFISATFEHDSGFSAVVGSFGNDFNGNYYSVSYGTEVNDIGLTVDWIYSDDDFGFIDGGQSNFVFGISKSFALDK